jgi:hypothetical protein
MIDLRNLPPIYFYLFICNLFNDAVSSDWITDNKLERIWKEVAVAYFNIL